MKFINMKQINEQADRLVHLCYSNSLKMASECRNMQEFLFVLCMLYYELPLLECIDRTQQFYPILWQVLLDYLFLKRTILPEHITFGRAWVLDQPITSLMHSIFNTSQCCGRVVHSTSKNTHTRDAPQAQTDPNNTICCHTTTLNIHTTVV